MSRTVSLDPSRTLAACGLLLATLVLAACGRDDAGDGASASTPPAATTPATTPAATTPAEAPKREREAGREQDDELQEDGTRKVEDPDANPAPDTPQGRARAALRKAGFDVEAFGATGQADASLRVDSDSVVAFYGSADVARQEELTFAGAFQGEGTVYGGVERRGSVLYMVTKTEKLSAAEEADFQRMIRTVEATR